MTLVYRTTHSPRALGNTLFSLQAPQIIFGLISGIMADRWNRKRIMIGADLYRMVAVAAIPFLPSIEFLYFVLISLSGAESFYNTAQVSLLPGILQGEGELISGNSFLQTTTTISMIVGPLIGAFVVANMGTTKAFLIDGATFLIAALLTLPIQQGCHPSGDKRSSISAFWNSFFGGFKYFIDNRPILILVILNGSILSSVFLTSSLKIAFADQFISPGGLDASKVLGYINSMNGIGSLIGGICLPFFAANYLAGKVIIIGMILTSLDLFCFALSNNLSLILTAIFISGFGFTMANLSSLTLMQVNIDNEVRGRALAFYGVILSISATCSTLAGGWIAGLAGVKFVYLMAAFFCLLTGTFGLILLSFAHKDSAFICHSGAGRNPGDR